MNKALIIGLICLLMASCNEQKSKDSIRKENNSERISLSSKEQNALDLLRNSVI